jgi:hypothetical protein
MVCCVSKTNRNTPEQRWGDTGSPVLLLLCSVSDAHIQTFLSLAAIPAGPCLLPEVSVFLKILGRNHVPAAPIFGGRIWMEVGGECVLDLF